MSTRDTLIAILDLARWAPSGDNTQPWRFEIVSDHHIAVHGFDTRDHVVYDFNGWASQMAHGALLETLRLAATRFGLAASWQLRQGCAETNPVYDVALVPDQTLQEDPLVAFIEQRVVQRRPMRTTPLDAEMRKALTAVVGNLYTVQFFESFADRLKVARLLWHNAYLRLTCPEAYEVHREVIEWGVQTSEDRIPEPAVGVDPLTARLMHWVMGSWQRVEFFNRYLLGTVAPRIQLDFIPALACASHVLVRPTKPLGSIPDRVNAGVAMQRLWLEAARQGLLLQPEMTPVIFRWYVQAGQSISATPSIDEGAHQLRSRFEQLAGAGEDEPFAFFCRVGQSPQPASRSVRKPLSALMKADNA